MSTLGLTLDPIPGPDANAQRFRAFLDAHLDQELLRFTTAGSVDDGKSTLIGRLLHDTKSVYEDQLASIRASRVNRSGQAIDLSLLTDGLKAEREQGITIDVAYRYFSTSRRKFIIADTPGHEQYTRNMATGASTAGLAIVLIDARAFVKAGKLLPQSRRHTYIASLLRIPHVIAAINKMDLVDFSEEVFHQISAEYTALATKLGLTSVEVIPMSALTGDNVVEPTTAMPWYTGPTLLEYLETVPLRSTNTSSEPFRFPVQLVVRPNANFRGFAGRIERGEVHPGMKVKALPSGRTTTVKSIVTYDGELKSAQSPRAITLELEDEIDLSRGEMLIAVGNTEPTASTFFASSGTLPAPGALLGTGFSPFVPSAKKEGASAPEGEPHIATSFRAMLVWMHEQPLTLGATYLLKHTTRTVRATIDRIAYRVDINTTSHLPATELAMNDIAEVEFTTALPIFFDPYADSREMGAIILIDPLSNATVGAAMLLAPIAQATIPGAPSSPAFSSPARVGMHAPFSSTNPNLFFVDSPSHAAALIAQLHQQGRTAILIDDPLIPDSAIQAAARALELAGIIAITTRKPPY